MLVMEAPFFETEVERIDQTMRKDGGKREAADWGKGYLQSNF